MGDGVYPAMPAARVLEAPLFGRPRRDLADDVAIDSAVRKTDLAQEDSRILEDTDALLPGADRVLPFADHDVAGHAEGLDGGSRSRGIQIAQVVGGDDGPHCERIQGAGAELRFLPPYSPDFNPIEMAFSKLKAYLKRRAARTLNELWEAIGQATDNFGTAECQNYFAAAGYDRV